jgi:hypothetical protein
MDTLRVIYQGFIQSPRAIFPPQITSIGPYYASLGIPFAALPLF